MVKCIWECAYENCGEKAIVPEDIIPEGWYRLELVHQTSKTPNPEKYETFDIPSRDELDYLETEECNIGCVIYDTIEACCASHAISVTTDTIKEMVLIKDSGADDE